MKKLTYIIMALALVLGLAQCKKEQPKPQGEKVYITLKVDDGAKHTVDPENGTVTYADGDVIYVGNGSKYIGSISHDGTKFSGTITVPDGTSKLYFYFVGGCTPSAAPEAGETANFTVNISDQSVKLPVLSLGEAAYTGEGEYTCELKNKCGLVKFVPSSPTSATVTLNGVYNRATIDFATPGITPTGATGNIALYPAADDAKWAILLPQSGATATATIGGITYAIESFPNITNNYYNNTGVNISSTVVFDPYNTPLTFEAMADGVTVNLHKFQTAQPSLQYRKNDGDWTTLTFVDSYYSTSISLNTGDKLSFKGDNTTLTENQNGYCKFELSGNCYVYGNIMSLLDKDNFPTNKMLSAGFTFYELFLNAPIYNHPSKTLVLPATTLTASCYADMFAGCTHLTTPPALPAATLANACYKNMFRGCTGLTTAPTLSATTLANECYRNMFGGCTALTTAPALQTESLANECYEEMFSGCTGLTTAPNLPAKTAAEYCYYYMFEDCTALATAPVLSATTMASHCYYAMFKGCTSLTTAPDLPATTLASYCYANMFLNCTGLTTAPTTLPATTLVANCYRSMFDGCTELTTAPVLPAATLQYYCYAWMFDGCTKLNSVTCLATNISADDCTYNWLNGVAASGTFTANNAGVGWSEGASGIPSGWDRVYLYSVVDLSGLAGNYEAQNNVILTGTLSENYKITIAAGATVTLDGVSINASGTWTTGNYAGITCLGDATIILSGTNTVKGFFEDYPGIYVPENKTVTIQGSGSLTASSNGYGAGIGGGWEINCGNIEIQGGTITATGDTGCAGIGAGNGGWNGASCGNITISGGTVTAIGGSYAAGIGSGYGQSADNPSTCGAISISGGTVRATAGALAPAAIGKGAAAVASSESTCASVTITPDITSLTLTNSVGDGIVSDFINATAVNANTTPITTMLSTSVTDPAITGEMASAGFATSYDEGTKTWTITKKE